MKPTLLYLKNYIQDNYNYARQVKQSDNLKINNKNNKISEQTIFRQKSSFLWQNRKKKEFYFQVPKSFNSLKQKKQQGKQIEKQNLKQFFIQCNSIHCKSNTQSQNQNPQSWNQSKQSQRQSIKQIQQTKIQSKPSQRIKIQSFKNSQSRRNSLNKQMKQSFSYEVDLQSDENKRQKQVRFIISPPIENFSEKSLIQQRNQPSSQQIVPKIIDEIDEIQSVQQIIRKSNEEQFKFLKYSQQTVHIQHSSITCKSIKKLGYNTLKDYLEQMKKVEAIKKKEIKQACYYPLSCMTPQIDQRQVYEETSYIEKEKFHQRLNHFKKLILIEDNFSTKNIQLEALTSSLASSKKQKSKFKKNTVSLNKLKQDQIQMMNKRQKFLLEYQSIAVVNCSNKKFFKHKLSNGSDFTSFFKFSTPLLQSTPNKENNYLIGNNQSNYLGLYFCSLINTTFCVREFFFWIGKPIQYYRKDKLIQVIDKFLSQIDAIDLFQSEKIWIIDYHGRNSYIKKDLLKKCNQAKPIKSLCNSKISKSRVSKRISFSASKKMENSDTSDTVFGLLANSLEFHQSIFYKKQRNNISTRGLFKFVYNSSQNE